MTLLRSWHETDLGNINPTPPLPPLFASAKQAGSFWKQNASKNWVMIYKRNSGTEAQM